MQITKFRTFLEGYVNFLEEMAAGEQEKYSAILSYDPKQMDKVVSRQQAMNMRLNQLEEQREKEQEEAGIAALTFQEILDRLEGEEKEAFGQLFRRFQKAVEEVRYFNEKSMTFVQDGIKMLGVEKETPKAPYTHSGKANPESIQGTSLFEAKV